MKPHSKLRQMKLSEFSKKSKRNGTKTKKAETQP
jgi:hypothetical protein